MIKSPSTRSHSSRCIPPGTVVPATWIVIPVSRLLLFTGVVTGVPPAALLVLCLLCWLGSGAGGGGRGVLLSCALGGFPPGRVVLLSPQSACMAGEWPCRSRNRASSIGRMKSVTLGVYANMCTSALMQGGRGALISLVAYPGKDGTWSLG